ncbi:hypothetical protein L9F63_021862 [Diploptera punctata]|uniref:Uncharacterized protein n=1 Tax=Diploptera punctata TaxID=6984 RepID=A0AAD7ZPE6_DIPPU|nr:hypothetical protein L9F63_021862 [Diploptera punctata]
MPLRYNVNGDYAVFTRMKEKGISLAAFATTILFLILTVVMVSVTLQSAYAWLVMGSTLFLFVTLCSYSSCEKTHSSQWRRASINSDSISTISDARDLTVGDFNRSILPYWITDLPPSYAAATSGINSPDIAPTHDTNTQSPPPPYSSVVDLTSPTQHSDNTSAQNEIKQDISARQEPSCTSAFTEGKKQPHQTI